MLKECYIFVLNGFAIDDIPLDDRDISDFVIGDYAEDNVIAERQALKANTEKQHVVKKYALVAIVSVFMHLLLFFLLSTVAVKPLQKPVKTTQKAIKSYLYKKPISIEKPKTKSKPITPKTIEQHKDLKEEQAKKEQNIKKQEEPKEVNEVSKINKDKIEKTLKATSTPSQNIKQTPQVKTKAVTNFSSYQQLDKLRKSIDDKIMSEELSQLQQFRSPSVMHGEQIPVPHSQKQLTPEQERDKNTTKMSDSISITKHDNGVCIIEREQFLGSPVEGSSSAFDCGESKFDKSFREHMKKVQAKLKPAKN